MGVHRWEHMPPSDSSCVQLQFCQVHVRRRPMPPRAPSERPLSIFAVPLPHRHRYTLLLFRQRGKISVPMTPDNMRANFNVNEFAQRSACCLGSLHMHCT